MTWASLCLLRPSTHAWPCPPLPGPHLALLFLVLCHTSGLASPPPCTHLTLALLPTPCHPQAEACTCLALNALGQRLTLNLPLALPFPYCLLAETHPHLATLQAKAPPHLALPLSGRGSPAPPPCLAALGLTLAFTSQPLGRGSPSPSPLLALTSPCPHLAAFELRLALDTLGLSLTVLSPSPPSGRGSPSPSLLALTFPCPHLATLRLRLALNALRPRLALTSLMLSPQQRLAFALALPPFRPRITLTSHSGRGLPSPHLALASPSPHCPQAKPHPQHPPAETCPHLVLTSVPSGRDSPLHHPYLTLALPLPGCPGSEAHPHLAALASPRHPRAKACPRLALASPSPHCLLTEAHPCLAALGLRLILSSPHSPWPRPGLAALGPHLARAFPCPALALPSSIRPQAEAHPCFSFNSPPSGQGLPLPCPCLSLTFSCLTLSSLPSG